MAENKKSFLVYADWIHSTEKMTDQEAGQLFKHLLRYVNDKDPKAPNRLIELAFEPWKQQLKRDLQKYKERSEKNAANARKRWEQKQANASEPMRSHANDADTDTDTGNDTDKDSIEVRSAAFYQKLASFVELYGKEMIREFYDYWTEHNERGKKMRFEMAKNQPFDIKRRLVTWNKKQKQYGSKGASKATGGGTAQTTQTRQDY